MLRMTMEDGDDADAADDDEEADGDDDACEENKGVMMKMMIEKKMGRQKRVY